MYLRQAIFVHSRPGGRDRGSTIHGCAGLVKGAPSRTVQCEISEISEKSRNAVSPAITDGIRTIGSADVTGAKKAKKAKEPRHCAVPRAFRSQSGRRLPDAAVGGLDVIADSISTGRPPVSAFSITICCFVTIA